MQHAAHFQEIHNARSKGNPTEQRTGCLEPGSRPPFDEFPIFKYLPRSWFSWYQKASDSRETTHRIFTEARRRVDERRQRGDKRDCIADALIDQFEASEWPISQLSFNLLLGELIEGGADTSAAALRTLILALVTNPDIQKKAQGELDMVCGDQRSPQWSDFEHLPYINMLVKEGLRWRPMYVSPSLIFLGATVRVFDFIGRQN